MTDSSGNWNAEWLARGVFVDPRAVVDEGAIIGKGTRIWHFTHIRSTAVIGPDCTIGQCCYVDADVSIGARCKIANGVQIYSGVKVCNEVFIGPNTTFTNDIWPRACDDEGTLIEFSDPKRTLVNDGASIGAGCVILPFEIGWKAMIAAGSVVTCDVDPKTRYLSKCNQRAI